MSDLATELTIIELVLDPESTCGAAVFEVPVIEHVLETGIPGPPGAAADILTATGTAAAVLSSNCLVGYDESGGIIRADAALGIPAVALVRQAAGIGDSVALVPLGRVNGYSGLTPGGACWLASSGALTQTPPAGGQLTQMVGHAAAADTLFLDIHPPIQHS